MYKPMTLTAAVVLAAGSQVLAGPEWNESNFGTDAGPLPSSAQVPEGNGLLTQIKGTLAGTTFGPGDFQDMFLVFIADPAGFSASIGPADFDTQLWLFEQRIVDGSREEGFGLLANDDIAVGKPLSGFGNRANDPTGAEVTRPGLYYIAISGFDSDPLSQGGEIFFQETRTEISGPDGEGGRFPIVDWTGPGEVGGYFVNLTGVVFVPGPSGLALLAGAGCLGRRRRRR